MKEYKNIDDFNSHIFNDTIDYIFDTFIFEKIENYKKSVESNEELLDIVNEN